MKIPLNTINHKFIHKPLLIGGQAKEYHGVRKAGIDYDFVVSKEDYESLTNKYPDNLKDLYGDKGIIIDDFEFWRSIVLFDYEYLKSDANETGDYLIMSLEKLLFLSALSMDKPKYFEDLKLIVKKIKDRQYKQ